MKHLANFALGAMALLAVSCSSDEPLVNGPDSPDADGDVYATLNLKLPTGTRATNNPVGEEFGQDYENYVSKVIVVLTQKSGNNYMFLTYDEADTFEDGILEGDNHENVQKELKYTLNFNAKDLTPNGLDVSGEDGKDNVYVFAFCNPTKRLQTIISNMTPGSIAFDGNNTGLIDTDNTIWNEKKFLMTNCHIPAAVKLPSKNELVANYNKPEKAFSLGTVHVKRVAARFDFALGGENNDNKYVIQNSFAEGNMGTVELTDMAMFNIAKNFYYLPRSNDQWDWKGTTTLCGDLENAYVMSYNLGDFKYNPLKDETYKKYYFANLIGNKFTEGETEDPGAGLTGGSTKLTWTSIRPADWNTKTEDTNDGWTQDPKNDYRIWRYATENTIPAADAQNSTSSQKVGITTGVVFKGEFTPENNTVWNGNVIYIHNGIVYGDFNALKAYVTKYPETVVAKDFAEVSKFNGADVSDLKKNLLDDVSKTNRHGFKAYAPNTGTNKYTMYYFYYNRHNSNGNNSHMGENEFGVVRNNVYKLRVTQCSSLGEPTAPEDPDDPNEEESAYFTVSCHVMPWTVRINNIEF